LRAKESLFSTNVKDDFGEDGADDLIAVSKNRQRSHSPVIKYNEDAFNIAMNNAKQKMINVYLKRPYKVKTFGEKQRIRD